MKGEFQIFTAFAKCNFCMTPALMRPTPHVSKNGNDAHAAFKIGGIDRRPRESIDCDSSMLPLTYRKNRNPL